MIRSVLFSVLLSAVLIYAVLRLHSSYEDVLASQVTSIDVYSDRISYRTNQYPTVSRLRIGLLASNDPPRKVALHDCARLTEFEAVLDLVREQGYTEFEIDLPDSC
jgi:hypothetical protein